MAYQTEEYRLLDGRVLLYRTTQSNAKWQYRIWVQSARKYVRKSTRTVNKADAERIATDAYFDVQAKERAEIPVFTKTYNDVLDELFVKWEQERELGNITQGRLDELNRIARLYYRRFFGKLQLASINQAVLDEFWLYRVTFWQKPEHEKLRKEFNINHVSKSPSYHTLRMELPLIRDVLQHGVKLGLLMPHQMPDIRVPKSKAVNSQGKKSKRRPALTDEQLKQMEEYMEVFAEAGVHPQLPDTPEKLYRRRCAVEFIRLLVHVGVREGAARSLRWRDVQIVNNGNTRYTLLNCSGKNHVYEPVAHPKVYDDLQAFKAVTPWSKDDDFVFAHYKTGQPDNGLDHQFRQMQKYGALAGYEFQTDTHGDNITLYSMRHTYATRQRRHFGRSYEDLSINMGTDPGQLKAHYDHVQPKEVAERLSAQYEKTKQERQPTLKELGIETGKTEELD